MLVQQPVVKREPSVPAYVLVQLRRQVYEIMVHQDGMDAYTASRTSDGMTADELKSYIYYAT
jgi:hypothetical protein